LFEQIKLLVKLQRLDLDITRIARLKDENPRRVGELKDALERASQEMAQASARLEALKKERRTAEREVEEGEEKLKKSQQRLLDVKTNQEYKAMLKEIEHLREAIRAAEDRVLELMEGLTAAESETAEYTKAYAERKGRDEARIKELEGMHETFEAEVRELEGQRAELARDIDPQLRNRYEFVRARRNGIGMIPVKDGVCQACYVEIPPQMFNELQRSEDVKECPSCNRLIYWGGAKELEEEEEKAQGESQNSQPVAEAF